MSFQLGVNRELGSLRLHIWPVGERHKPQDGPDIHSHAWHLSSRVLAGEYSDMLYDVEYLSPAEELPESEDTFYIFASKLSSSGAYILVTEGAIVRAKPITDRHVLAGGHHDIPAGVYHQTTVPAHLLAATLIVDSPAFTETTGVLIRASGTNTISRSRQSVTADDVAAAKQQVIAATG